MPDSTKKQQRDKERRRVRSATNTDNYTYIPEKENIENIKSDQYQRVAIYARVSTDNPSQTTSFELQQKYYTEMVSRNPKWELVKIYSDEGRSGTTIQYRVGFQEMLEDAFGGKIDLIIVKNISRFARNVVDFLSTLRKLRAKKVGVYFESEGIYSMNIDMHLALSFQATVAEEESRLRSRSMETSLRMRLDHGLPLTPELLGFYKDADGKLRANPETKDIPKLMFYMYLYGYSTLQIADTLIKLMKRSYLGNVKWTANGVARTLRNERYCGNVLTRKRFKIFAPDVDDQKTFKNNGERPQSYYREEHDRIVSYDDFTAVQRMMDNAKYGGASLLPELKVIPEGLLKGFVIVHPKWGSFTEEDYMNACRSVYEGEDSKNNIDESIGVNITVNKGDFDFREFQVVDFKLFDDQCVPAIMVDKNTVKFNQSCIREMSCGNYVELLVHPLNKQLAIRPTEKANRYGIPWAKGDAGSQANRGVGCAAFGGVMAGLLGYEDYEKYKIYGRIYRDSNTAVCIFTKYDSCVYINKEQYLSSAVEVTGQILNKAGKCIKAVAGIPGHSFGEDYYVEMSRRDLTFLTKEQWKTRIEGQLCAAGDKLNVTSYEELREFIKEQLGDLFEEI